jgi:hypothetical protein
MYKLKLKNNYATITKNGKEIEPLSGLFMANQSEVNELAELVRLANKAFQQGVERTASQTDIPYPDSNSANYRFVKA